MHAMIANRPDITFAVGVVSWYMVNPRKRHREAIKCIMRYMKGTKEACICFGRGDLHVLGYTDSDYAEHVDTKRSISTDVFTFGGSVVSWMSRTQKCVALSATKAEYVVATEGCKKAIWLDHLMGDLEIHIGVPTLHSDSMSAIQRTKSDLLCKDQTH